MNAFRIQHLLLAIAAVAAYLTTEELGLVHAWAGYVAGALIIMRLLFGLAHRRGFEFRRLIPSFAKPPLGQSGLRHPAIGRALMLALLLSVSGTAATGIAMDGGGTLVGKSIRADDGEKGEHEEREGDEAAFSALQLIPAARVDEPGEGDGEGEEEGLLGEIHETLGNLLLPLVLIHIAYMLLLRFDMARFLLFIPKRKKA